MTYRISNGKKIIYKAIDICEKFHVSYYTSTKALYFKGFADVLEDVDLLS